MHPQIIAGVVELVDTLDLGSSAARCESSSLSARTRLFRNGEFFYAVNFIERIKKKDEKFIPSEAEGSLSARTKKELVFASSFFMNKSEILTK